jgi:Phospholipase_D-nuclease N-terminal
MPQDSFFFLILTIDATIGAVFWIWMIIDCATKEPAQGNDKVVWLLVILLTQFIGALIYVFVRRPTRRKLFGQ